MPKRQTGILCVCRQQNAAIESVIILCSGFANTLIAESMCWSVTTVVLIRNRLHCHTHTLCLTTIPSIHSVWPSQFIWNCLLTLNTVSWCWFGFSLSISLCIIIIVGIEIVLEIHCHCSDHILYTFSASPHSLPILCTVVHIVHIRMKAQIQWTLYPIRAEEIQRVSLMVGSMRYRLI